MRKVLDTAVIMMLSGVLLLSGCDSTDTQLTPESISRMESFSDDLSLFQSYMTNGSEDLAMLAKEGVFIANLNGHLTYFQVGLDDLDMMAEDVVDTTLEQRYLSVGYSTENKQYVAYVGYSGEDYSVTLRLSFEKEDTSYSLIGCGRHLTETRSSMDNSSDGSDNTTSKPDTAGPSGIVEGEERPGIIVGGWTPDYSFSEDGETTNDFSFSDPESTTSGYDFVDGTTSADYSWAESTAETDIPADSTPSSETTLPEETAVESGTTEPDETTGVSLTPPPDLPPGVEWDL